MAKRFISFDRFWKRREINTWLDRLSFINILFIWVGIILVFGIIYFFFITNQSFLFSNLDGRPVREIVDAIYFSFITATSTGFGDIVPLGAYKIVSIFEVILGLLLLAFVTSKLVSLKQNVILNEIYEISFNERISRLRSSLLLFRQNVNRTINRVEDNSVKKREMDEINVYFSTLENVLKEIFTLLNKRRSDHFTKGIDPVDVELIFNSIISSFKRVNELVSVLNESELEWNREMMLSFIYRCLALDRGVFEKLKERRVLSEQVIKELEERNGKVVGLIKDELHPKN